MHSMKRISSHGSVSIPVKLRRELNMQPRDALDVTTDASGNIILSPHNPRCALCGSTEQLALIKGKRICRVCCLTALEQLVGGASDE